MVFLYLIIAILLLILIIVNYIKYLNGKTRFFKLLLLEIFSIVLFVIIMLYYNGGGLSNIAEFLLGFGAAILYSIILVITMMTELVSFLLTKKEQGKNCFPIIGKVIAVLLFVAGVFYLIVDLENDINVGKTQAQIIDYENNQYGYERPIVEYKINNKNYQVQIEIFTEEFRNSNIGDTVEINYNKKNPSELAYFSYYEELYIPCFLISIVLFIVSKKKQK